MSVFGSQGDSHDDEDAQPGGRHVDSHIRIGSDVETPLSNRAAYCPVVSQILMPGSDVGSYLVQGYESLLMTKEKGVGGPLTTAGASSLYHSKCSGCGIEGPREAEATVTSSRIWMQSTRRLLIHTSAGDRLGFGPQRFHTVNLSSRVLPRRFGPKVSVQRNSGGEERELMLGEEWRGYGRDVGDVSGHRRSGTSFLAVLSHIGLLPSDRAVLSGP
ncbi:hypothetical protein AAG570_014109 [Ranatra chinensis]|uniref:Uncharacterized protein n=1 Tax=Ranatra chinensis TaxID=642074 RepID=A0ABD0XRZ9_9HEMI